VSIAPVAQESFRYGLPMRLLLVLMVTCAIEPTAAAAAKVFTLAELVAKVRNEYPGVLAARQAVEGAKAEAKIAARGWAPWGWMDAQIFGARQSQCQLPGERFPDGTPTSTREHNCYTNGLSLFLSGQASILQQLPIWGVSLGVDATLFQPLYSFGKIEANVEAANVAVASAQQAERVVVEEAILNATRAYWGVKAARTARDVLSDVIEKLHQWTDKIVAEMEGINKGGYTEADLARLKTALDGLVLNRLDVERNLGCPC
jgi:outer membrane protein TolC